MALTAHYCRNHPERPGMGLCVRCRSPVCEECSTRVEGVLHCKACLGNVLEETKRSRWRSASALLPLLLCLPCAYLVVVGVLILIALALAGAGV